MRALRNPWTKGLMAFSVGAGACGVLFAVGLMVAMAAGADLSGGPLVGSQAAGIILLSVTAVLVFVLVMSVRWDAKHRKVRR